MRIVIEIDGVQGTAMTGPDTPGIDGETDEVAFDAGTGPSQGTDGTAGTAASVVTDSGPPPDWLLEAVAAAEAAGFQTGLAGAADADNGPSKDAGAGPSAEAWSGDGA